MPKWPKRVWHSLALWLTHYPKGTQRVQHALFITEKYYIEIIISSKSGGWLSYSVYPTELQIADLQIHLRGSVPFEHCQDFKTLLPFWIFFKLRQYFKDIIFKPELPTNFEQDWLLYTVQWKFYLMSSLRLWSLRSWQ